MLLNTRVVLLSNPKDLSSQQIVYVNDVCFMGSKDSLLLLELKQKFITKWKCCNLGETKNFLGMCINCNYKDQKIFIDQSEYLNKVLV